MRRKGGWDGWGVGREVDGRDGGLEGKWMGGMGGWKGGGWEGWGVGREVDGRDRGLGGRWKDVHKNICT